MMRAESCGKELAENRGATATNCTEPLPLKRFRVIVQKGYCNVSVGWR